ncbi:hypothetical protein D3C78_1238200 [compost metagenome]
MQQVQEVAADGVFVAGAVDAHAMVGEAVPVAHHRREQGQQAIGLVALLFEGQLGFQGAKHRATGTHHIHRMCIGGDALEHFFQRLWQVAQGLEPALVLGQLGCTRQIAVKQQVGDFFEFGASGQVTDVITTVGQAGSGLSDCRQCSLPGHLTTQAGSTEYFCFGHRFSPLLNLLWNLWLIAGQARFYRVQQVFNPFSGRTGRRGFARTRGN